jgi:hypothetical protein
MTAVESQPIMPTYMGQHPSIASGHFSPSLSSQTPPLSNMGRMASHRSNSFGASDPIALHFNPSHDAAFNGLDVGLGADLRRGRFDARHRPSRSESYRSDSPFQNPPDFLAPSAAYGQSNPTYSFPGAVRSQDPMGTNMASSIGPTRHVRRLSSGSPYPDRPGSVSSARPSPYPSPSGSPSLLPQGLPPNGMSEGDLSDGNPWAKVERQQVTTPATAKASEGRRKGEASFVCPVPGCGSTFTRHFNLKGEYSLTFISLPFD